MPAPKQNPAIEVQVRHFQSQHILQYIASLRASAQRTRMYAYAYVHAHTPIDKSAAWNGRLHYYLPDHVMRHFLSFFSARACTFFLLSSVGEVYAR